MGPGPPAPHIALCVLSNMVTPCRTSGGNGDGLVQHCARQCRYSGQGAPFCLPGAWPRRWLHPQWTTSSQPGAACIACTCRQVDGHCMDALLDCWWRQHDAWGCSGSACNQVRQSLAACKIETQHMLSRLTSSPRNLNSMYCTSCCLHFCTSAFRLRFTAVGCIRNYCSKQLPPGQPTLFTWLAQPHSPTPNTARPDCATGRPASPSLSP